MDGPLNQHSKARRVQKVCGEIEFSRREAYFVTMYFDFHFHPGFKSFLSDTDPARRHDCWKTYRNFIDFVFGGIVDSQASFRQIDRSQTRIGVAAVYAMEDGLDEIGLIRNLAPIVSHVDKDMVRDLRPARYWERMLEEIRHLEGSLGTRGGARPFRIVSSREEIGLDHNNLVLAIEGAHVLDGAGEDPLERLDELKNFRHRILYLTLCHFAQNPLCTQAYAMKLVKPTKVPAFLPAGTGLTELGKSVIRRCYDTATGRRILIDIKHMSLSGRQQFYAWKRANPELRDIPIVASHVGVTGLSWAYAKRKAYWAEERFLSSLGQWAIDYDKRAGLRLGRLESSFNPSTINLFDEDIREVIASGGLIGVMLDQRQLGVNKKPFEYFAAADHAALSEQPEFPPNAKSSTSERSYVNKHYRRENLDMLSLPSLGISAAVTSVRGFFSGDGKKGDKSTIARSTTSVPADPVAGHRAPKLNRKKRLHLLHLCNNLLHIIRVGGPAAWDYICIGSDFDGLVDAPNNCESVMEYPDLEVHLRGMLRDLVDAYGPVFATEMGLEEIDERVRQVMGGNGVRWVEEQLG